MVNLEAVKQADYIIVNRPPNGERQVLLASPHHANERTLATDRLWPISVVATGF